MKLTICTLFLAALAQVITAADQNTKNAKSPASPKPNNATASSTSKNHTDSSKSANAKNTTSTPPKKESKPADKPSAASNAKPAAPAEKPKNETTQTIIQDLENKRKGANAKIADLKKKLDGTKDSKEKSQLQSQLQAEQKKLDEFEKALKDCKNGVNCGNPDKKPTPSQPLPKPASIPTPSAVHTSAGAQTVNQNDAQELIESLKLAIILSRLKEIQSAGTQEVAQQQQTTSVTPLPVSSTRSEFANQPVTQGATNTFVTSAQAIVTGVPNLAQSVILDTSQTFPKTTEVSVNLDTSQTFPKTTEVPVPKVSYSKLNSMSGAKDRTIAATEPGLLESSAIFVKPIFFSSIIPMTLISFLLI